MCAPSFAIASAIPRPMPLAAPVMMATLSTNKPLRSVMLSSPWSLTHGITRWSARGLMPYKVILAQDDLIDELFYEEPRLEEQGDQQEGSEFDEIGPPTHQICIQAYREYQRADRQRQIDRKMQK